MYANTERLKTYNLEKLGISEKCPTWMKTFFPEKNFGNTGQKVHKSRC